MVTVIGYKVRTKQNGEQFIALELSGSLEIIQSSQTGNMYATVRRCTIPSTFNEQMAQMMVGTQIEGEIVRIECVPYEYAVKSTGEVVTLGYTYGYRPKGSQQTIGAGTVDIEPPVAPVKPHSPAIRKAARKSLDELASEL